MQNFNTNFSLPLFGLDRRCQIERQSRAMWISHKIRGLARIMKSYNRRIPGIDVRLAELEFDGEI